MSDVKHPDWWVFGWYRLIHTTERRTNAAVYRAITALMRTKWKDGDLQRIILHNAELTRPEPHDKSYE